MTPRGTVLTTTAAGALVGLILFPFSTGQPESALTGLFFGGLLGVFMGLLIVRSG